MEHSRPKQMFFMEIDAKCTDEETGKLLGAYLFDRLGPEKKRVFELHLEECIACDTDVINWGNLGVLKGD